MANEFRHLRVEEPAPLAAPEAVVAFPAQAERGIDEWRKLAIQSSERLQYAENQLKDLREQADDVRARLTKSKTRLDSANARINDLQVVLVNTTVERDELRDRVARLDVIKRRVYEYRQSLLEGPLWELFAEL